VRQLPSITITQLDYLVAVADAPTWADAAAGLGVTPSALSQGLAELERRLDFALFERQGRRRIVASRSAEVLAYARRVTAQTADLARWIDDARSGRAGSLRVGMIDAAALGHWPALLQEFRQTHPDLSLRLSIAPSGELLSQLLRDQLDLAVIVAPSEIPIGIGWIDLLTDPLAVYAPPNTPIGPPSTWGPWVSFPTTSHTRELIEAALDELGVRFEVTSESHQPEVLRAMVRLGMGWTVLPVIQAETGPHPLVRARTEPLVTRSLITARREGALPHPMIDEFEARLRESASSTP
jgi:DNA-binding transcriptional LysR family regulator